MCRDFVDIFLAASFEPAEFGFEVLALFYHLGFVGRSESALLSAAVAKEFGVSHLCFEILYLLLALALNGGKGLAEGNQFVATLKVGNLLVDGGDVGFFLLKISLCREIGEYWWYEAWQCVSIANLSAEGGEVA